MSFSSGDHLSLLPFPWYIALSYTWPPLEVLVTALTRDPKMVSRLLWSSAGKIPSTPGENSGLKVLIAHITLTLALPSLFCKFVNFLLPPSFCYRLPQWEWVLRGICTPSSSFLANVSSSFFWQIKGTALSLAIALYSLDVHVVFLMPPPICWNYSAKFFWSQCCTLSVHFSTLASPQVEDFLNFGSHST